MAEAAQLGPTAVESEVTALRRLRPSPSRKQQSFADGLAKRVTDLPNSIDTQKAVSLNCAHTTSVLGALKCRRSKSNADLPLSLRPTSLDIAA